MQLRKSDEDYNFILQVISMSINTLPFSISTADTSKVFYIKDTLFKIINKHSPQTDEIVLLCIGSDRSTGDALGPITGSQLSKTCAKKFIIKGTLAHPVHAKNLSTIITDLQYTLANPFIIAIDACLGKSSNIGKIVVEEGPVKPGAGVNKELAPVGNCHITGIVNVGGFMEYMVLQNTRLHRVLLLSNTISQGINLALRKYSQNKTTCSS